MSHGSIYISLAASFPLKADQLKFQLKPVHPQMIQVAEADDDVTGSIPVPFQLHRGRSVVLPRADGQDH